MKKYIVEIDFIKFVFDEGEAALSFAEVRKDIARDFLGCDSLLCHHEYAVLSQNMP